jgi:hypothetical protein
LNTRHAYIRDGAAIYERSFAIIRAESDLSRFSGTAERVVVRMIHACGMTDLPKDVAMSPDFVEAAEAALVKGAPILCDARMVADGVTRARLPAKNEVICTLPDPSVPKLAEEMGTTRSAAAMELWRPHLAGSRRRDRQCADLAVPPARHARRGRPEARRRDRHPRRLRRRGGIEGSAGAGRARALPRRARPARRLGHGGGSGQRAGAGEGVSGVSERAPRTLLYGVGLGPGDPDYMTVRARDIILKADRLVHFCKRGRRGNARITADAIIAPDPAREIELAFPVTTEVPVEDEGYTGPIAAFYDEAAEQLAAEMTDGRSIAVLCDGDPFFYGSFMHLWRRLAHRFPTEVVPGVTGMAGAWDPRRRPDQLGRRRDDRGAGHARRGRTDAPSRRYRCGGDHEARPQPAQGAPRAAGGRADQPRHLCRARHHGRAEVVTRSPRRPMTRRPISR